MKVKLIIISIILLLVMVFACGCIPFMENLGILTPPEEEQLSPEKGGPPEGLVKVLIGFKQKPGPAEQAVVKGVGGQIKYTYHIVDAIAASIPQKAIDALQKNPNVRYVEPDGMVYALDAELDDSWGVKRIGAGLVHDSLNKGAGVKVAIIDSGIDYNHPDLNSNYWGGYDFVNDDSDPMDDNGHGTHVAGTVAALDDGIGVVGVAPEANLYALKVLSSGGSGSYSDVIAALQWCVDNGIQVTNNSYGSSGDPGKTVKAAFDNSYNNGNGVLHVAAAGNSGNRYGVGDNIIYPARYDSVIAVAATDRSDKRASWSSTGPDLELSAPGVSIYSTYLTNSYNTFSGTSMASPHVAGTAALVIAAGISDVRAQLKSTADDLGAAGWDSKYGYGLVNAAKAAGVESPPPKYDLIVDILPEAAETAGASTNPTTGTYTDYAAAGDSVTVVASDPSDGSWTFVNWTIGVDVKSTNKSYTFNMPAADVTIVANFEAVPPSITDNMHVKSIEMSLKKTAGIYVNAIATVTIVYGNVNPVEGATVDGHWSGATSDVDSGVTDIYGKVSLESNKVRKPKRGTIFTFTVDNVSKVGWTYDPLANVETSDSIMVK